MAVSAAVQQMRRDTALQKELEAVQSELQADQIERALEMAAVPEGPQLLINSEQQAEDARRRANAMHEHAGTTPEDFKAQVEEQLRNQLASMQIDLERQIEMRDHAEIYGVDPRRAAWDAAMRQAGVEVIEKRVGESDAGSGKKARS